MSKSTIASGPSSKTLRKRSSLSRSGDALRLRGFRNALRGFFADFDLLVVLSRGGDFLRDFGAAFRGFFADFDLLASVSRSGDASRGFGDVLRGFGAASRGFGGALRGFGAALRGFGGALRGFFADFDLLAIMQLSWLRLAHARLRSGPRGNGE